MFCSSCGKPMEAGARFCSSCGTAWHRADYAQEPFFGQLTRPRHPRVLGGVCSGLALHYGWDVTLVRLIWVICVFFAGTGVLVYLIAWIVIPEAPYALPERSTAGPIA